MQVSKNFKLKEFVSPGIYKGWGKKSIWQLDQRIIGLAQAVRELFDEPITINGRFNGRKYTDSGYRSPRSRTGGKKSQHRAGRAIDLKFHKSNDYDEIRRIIIANYAELSKYGLTTMEDKTRNWLHLDIRWSLNPKDLMIFQP